MSKDEITLDRKDFLRIIKELAIQKKHISDLYRQTFGMKNFDFDTILQETARDFGVSFEELDNVKFAGYEVEDTNER